MRISRNTLIWFLTWHRRKRRAGTQSQPDGISIVFVDSAGRRLITNVSQSLSASFVYYHLKDSQGRLLISSSGALITISKA